MLTMLSQCLRMPTKHAYGCKPDAYTNGRTYGLTKTKHPAASGFHAVTRTRTYGIFDDLDAR